MVSMADVLTELESYVSYIQGLFPDAHIERQNIPKNPDANTFVIKVVGTDIEQHGEYTFVEREITIHYVGKSDLDVFQVAEQIRMDLRNRKNTIPLVGSKQHIQVTNFSHSEPFTYTESDYRGLIYVLTSVTKEIRESAPESLINEVKVQFNGEREEIK